ncbi:MAG: hypothetical protein LC135_04000 [Phycisphaerae bacterium]|jgi:hypothetical protein|nr:hypothetical protein [Phycisphaerae bacterium]MCZ2399014.1 hypothetical protein [Phycisphaerae bacterium]
MRRLVIRARAKAAALTIGGMLVLSGCDPNVRDTVLGGVESASTSLLATFVAAFFESLNDPQDAPATVQLFTSDVPQFA